MKFEKLKPGMVVYSVGKQKMGNTTLTTTTVWTVQIISVDQESRTAVASWNGNPPRKYYEHDIAKLKEKRPMLIRLGMGRARLATREEIKAAKLAEAGTA